ncbi:ABC transporter permease [Archangium sp.]|uniref:ABC transporter permease n=1 Tax=Archangium sp. TaxID=1872627 RepID=UPI00286AD73B|nr:ABC transporter permease [Archangium sp.]
MTSWMDELSRDVRFALRRLAKSPGFTTVAVLCLALGIGANAAIFSVVDATLLRPLPYAEPERLVRLYETMPQRDPNLRESASWPNVRDWAQQLQSLEGLAAYTFKGRNLSGAEGSERLRVAEVSANLFQVLGVAPRLGRAFSPGEDVPGTAPVVVVSEGLWKRRFGENPAVLGQSLTLDGQPYTIIGVLPASVQFPPGAQLDLFVPLAVTGPRAEARGSRFLGVLGRLKPGVSVEAANTELRQLVTRLQEAYPNDLAGRSASAVPLTETVIGKVRPVLLILQGTVLLVLLIACANVANLLLAQGASRQQEIAIRLALGASRARLIRQMLVESLVLALVGSALGAVLASWGLSALETLVKRSLPLIGDIALRGNVFGLLLLVAVGSSVLFGLVPALQATRTELRASLGEGGTKASSSRANHRFRGGLVVGELALSLILLVGAGLLMRGFVTLLGEQTGFDTRGVLTARMSVPAYKYPSKEAPQRLFQPLLEQLRAQPGVQSVGLTSLLPIQQGSITTGYTIEGDPAPEPGNDPVAEFRALSPGLYKSLGIPLVAGRDFTEQDGQGELVVIVNQALAQRHFGQGEAVGRRLTFMRQTATIIGVVGDVRQGGLDRKPVPEIDLPYNQTEANPFGLQDVFLVVKTTVEPTAAASTLRGVVRSVDSELAIDEVYTMEEVISRSMASRRMNLVLLGSFAVIALVLATAGLYGVISYTVSQRTRELGIRMALGAQPADVVKLVMRQGALLAVLGLGAGLVGAFGLSRFLEGLLYGVSTTDPLTFGSLALLLGAIALLATWMPARRASRVDPIIAIKGE